MVQRDLPVEHLGLGIAGELIVPLPPLQNQLPVRLIPAGRLADNHPVHPLPRHLGTGRPKLILPLRPDWSGGAHRYCTSSSRGLRSSWSREGRAPSAG